MTAPGRVTFPSTKVPTGAPNLRSGASSNKKLMASEKKSFRSGKHITNNSSSMTQSPLNAENAVVVVVVRGESGIVNFLVDRDTVGWQQQPESQLVWEKWKLPGSWGDLQE